MLGLSCGQAMAAPGAYKVLFAYATDGTNGCYSHVLQNELATEPGIASITTFDASTGTPTVAQLDGYDMVVTISDCDAYWDPATMGDNLAQYAKQGGVVVEYPFGMENSSPYGLTGAWLSASPRSDESPCRAATEHAGDYQRPIRGQETQSGRGGFTSCKRNGGGKLSEYQWTIRTTE